MLPVLFNENRTKSFVRVRHNIQMTQASNRDRQMNTHNSHVTDRPITAKQRQTRGTREEVESSDLPPHSCSELEVEVLVSIFGGNL